MRRSLALVAGLCLFATPSLAQEALTPELLDAVKKATIYIRLDMGTASSTGSGFVVVADGDRALIVTNDHVVSHTPPSGPGIRPAKISVVFDSGQATERSYPAEIVAADKSRDLAVLRVTGVKDMPKPLAFDPPAKPVELMAAYTFGFPFGELLSENIKRSPAVTVGKASISSLRLGDDGELAAIQIDGAINPGNSGGPMVDAKGRVTGVAVKTVKGAGIGIIIPGAEVVKLMNGRTATGRITTRKNPDGRTTVRYEAVLLDPQKLIRSGTLHYALVQEGAEKVRGGVAQMPGHRSVPLTIDRNMAFCEFVVDKVDGDLQYQAVTGTSPSSVATFTLAPPPLPAANGGRPPATWKEYIVKDRSIGLWLPGGAKGDEVEKNSTIRGQRMKVNIVNVDVPGGLSAEAHMIALPAAMSAIPRNELQDIFLEKAREHGNISAPTAVKMGTVPGIEFRIEDGKDSTRTRIFINANRVYIVEVTGTPDMIEGRIAETFLASLHVPGKIAKLPPGPAPTTTVIQTPGTGIQQPPPVVPAPPVAPGVPIAADRAEVGKFNGTWRVVSYMKDGIDITAQATATASSVTFKDGEFQFEGSQIRGVITRIDNRRSPATVDYTYTGGPMQGTTQQAIYSIEDNAFIDCNADPKLPRPLTFASKSGVSLVCYARINPNDIASVQQPPPVAPRPAPPVRPVPRKADREHPVLGFTLGSDKYEDHAPAGGVLIGFEFGLAKFFKNDIVVACRPIYLTNGKESFGQQFGKASTGTMTIKAPAGYAVGALSAKTGLGIDGLSLTYMRIKDGNLDPRDAKESDWVGGQGGGGPNKVGGTGKVARGVAGCLNRDKNICAIGLVFDDAVAGNNAVPAAPPAVAAQPPAEARRGKSIIGPNGKRITPLIHDPKDGPVVFCGKENGDEPFVDKGPEGGILIGFEIATGPFDGLSVSRGYKPIYRVGNREVDGEARGEAYQFSTTVKAKDGYAVGGVVYHGTTWFNNFSLIFMKVNGDKLDPNDSYESGMVAEKKTDSLSSYKSDGTPITGFAGKYNARHRVVHGFGFVFKGN